MEYIIEELQLFLRNRQFAIENNPYVFEIVLGQKAKVVCLQDKLRKMISDERNTLDKEELRQIAILRKEKQIKKKSQRKSQKLIPLKYKKYSFALKKIVIEEILESIKEFPEISKGRFIREKAIKYDIHPKNIFRWMNQKRISNKDSGRKAKYPEFEAKLIQLIERNPFYKRKDILIKAKILKQQMNLDEQFILSKGWFERFRKRMKNNYYEKDGEQEWSFQVIENEENQMQDEEIKMEIKNQIFYEEE